MTSKLLNLVASNSFIPAYLLLSKPTGQLPPKNLGAAVAPGPGSCISVAAMSFVAHRDSDACETPVNFPALLARSPRSLVYPQQV